MKILYEDDHCGDLHPVLVIDVEELGGEVLFELVYGVLQSTLEISFKYDFWIGFGDIPHHVTKCSVWNVNIFFLDCKETPICDHWYNPFGFDLNHLTGFFMSVQKIRKGKASFAITALIWLLGTRTIRML